MLCQFPTRSHHVHQTSIAPAVNPLSIAPVMDASLLRAAATGGSVSARLRPRHDLLDLAHPITQEGQSPAALSYVWGSIGRYLRRVRRSQAATGDSKPQNADHARQIKERSPRLEHTNTQHRNGNKHSQRIHCGYFAVALPSHLFSLAATYNVCPRMDVWIDSRPRLTLATRAIHFRDRKDHHLNDALPTSRSSIRSQPLGSLVCVVL
jgi:hypothetical protein